LRTSGGLAVNFEYAEKIEHKIYLLNGILEGKSRTGWEVAGILTISEKKERLSILRD
jgi:hypothetical protein